MDVTSTTALVTAVGVLIGIAGPAVAAIINAARRRSWAAGEVDAGGPAGLPRPGQGASTTGASSD